MKRLLLIIAPIALVTGCLSGEPSEASSKQEPKKAEKKVNEEEAERKKYLDALKEEMERIDRMVEEVQEMETSPVVVAGKVQIDLDLPIAMIDVLDPPGEWKENHEEILTHLRTAKLLAGEAMDCYIEKDFDEGHNWMEKSGASLGRAQNAYNEIADEQ